MEKTEVYSRVVGYFRPVQQWNKGKQEEFKDRQEFVVEKEQDKHECHSRTSRVPRDLAYRLPRQSGRNRFSLGLHLALSFLP